MRKLQKRNLFYVLAFIIAVVSGVALFTNNEQEAPKTWSEVLAGEVGEPAYKSVSPDKPLEQQTSMFEVAGRTFDMPTVYIQSNLGSKRQQPDGINLLYVLPDYTSRADFENKAAYKEAFKEQRFAHMLLEPSAVRPSFDEMISNRKRRLGKFEVVEEFDGLEHEHWYHNYSGELVFYYDVYLEKDEVGRVLSWVECSTFERPAKYPGCSHRFRDKDLLYKIYYNKSNYLDEWRNQRSSAIQFIDGFDVTENEKYEKEN